MFKNLRISHSVQCYNNGFSYYENETWMSLETACSQCKCGPGGKFQCETDKHCSNTCPEGQIPQYGSCCEVLKCSGKGRVEIYPLMTSI